MTDDIKKAEARGYSRGYVAGRRKRKQSIRYEQQRKERQAFLDKAFLALLPAAMAAQGWTIAGRPVRTGSDRVGLAKIWAEEALLQRPIA
jgi:hypothetical protein